MRCNLPSELFALAQAWEVPEAAAAPPTLAGARSTGTFFNYDTRSAAFDRRTDPNAALWLSRPDAIGGLRW